MLEILSQRLENDTLVVSFRRTATFVGDPALPVPKNADGTPAVAVDEKGYATKLVSPAGESVSVTLEAKDVAAEDWSALTKAYATFVATSEKIANDHYTMLQKSPVALDQKILQAENAKRSIAESEAQLAEMNARLADARARSEAVTAELRAREAVAAAAVAEKT